MGEVEKRNYFHEVTTKRKSIAGGNGDTFPQEVYCHLFQQIVLVSSAPTIVYCAVGRAFPTSCVSTATSKVASATYRPV